MPSHHYLDCPVYGGTNKLRTSTNRRLCHDCDPFLDPKDEIMPQQPPPNDTKIYTCRYYTQAMGWNYFHMESTLTCKEIMETWRNARRQDEVLVVRDPKTNVWIGFPAADVLRYELLEGYHEPENPTP